MVARPGGRLQIFGAGGLFDDELVLEDLVLEAAVAGFVVSCLGEGRGVFAHDGADAFDDLRALGEAQAGENGERGLSGGGGFIDGLEDAQRAFREGGGGGRGNRGGRSRGGGAAQVAGDAPGDGFDVLVGQFHAALPPFGWIPCGRRGAASLPRIIWCTWFRR